MKQSIRIIRSSRANVLLAVLIYVPSCFSVSSVWLTGRCEFCRPICILPWGITNIRSGVTKISSKSGALWRKKYAKFCVFSSTSVQKCLHEALPWRLLASFVEVDENNASWEPRIWLPRIMHTSNNNWWDQC